MEFILRKIKFIMKDDNARSRHLFIRISCMLMVAFLIACLPIQESLAASGLKIYNYTTKKSSTYTDRQIKVTYNGDKISVDKTPGMLVNGVALVSYRDIFANSVIDADCVYNKPKGTVTVSKFGTTIVMTINSKKAYVNGKAVTMPVAPVKIKYISANVTKILVPSRFVSETLGFDYTWNKSTNTVAIEKDTDILSLSYNSGDRFSYKGTVGAVTIDGKKVSLGNMPSIITNNTAMLRAKRVFADSKIDADYKYNKADQSVTLSKDGKKLEMKIGSPVAYLNGKPIVLDTAPMIVYNYEAKTSFVMVPGSFTASCLGYDYAWNNSIRTSAITSRKDSEEPAKDTDGNQSPELSDSDIVDTGTLLHEFSALDSAFSKSTEQHELNSDMVPTGMPGTIFSVNRDYNIVKPNAETFMVIANTPFGKVTSSNSGQVINITATDMTSADTIYQINGVSGNFVSTIKTINRPLENSTNLEIQMIPEQYSYDLALSEDKLILYVTVYVNSLNNVKIGTNANGDYITLTGLKPLKVEFSSLENVVYIDLPYATNGIGEQNMFLTGTRYLNLLYAGGIPNKTQLILSVNGGFEHFVSEDNNQYTISFVDPNTAAEPKPEQPVGEDLPAVVDKSKYEIIIPKPAGLSSTQITHEDNYYNNKFSIKLQGDYTDFLSMNPVTWNSSVIKDVSTYLNSSFETVIQVSTTKLQGYEIITDNNNIYINIGNPRDIYKNIVILDAGHGGPANGASYFGTDEKDFNLKILYTLGKKYFNSDTSKLKVYYTRETDVDLSLRDRAAYASKMGADLFVSLHMNANLSSAVYGTEVYYSDNNNKTQSSGLNSKTLANLFVNNLSSGLGTKNRGIRSERYTVVYRNTVPAVLLELGFLSNKSDFAKLSNPDFQENAARILYETLTQVFELYPTGR